ncbi:sterol 26-hydroxylase, mitochondrial isoform X2 [Boleophthalmus pectinirostris]|uniref:sterol 26-hydroxylase, mitochondrial isoform X2 n=1 Tax=Boleophthalmus pectinirostris TaxID=150288 RepID=UPI00242A489E|nr:sterol 26-hydroxylase, mitochondrial isoform X2 [Boleophthalmus pectinirostris]
MLWKCLLARPWHHRCAGLLQAGQRTLIPAMKTRALGVGFLRQNASTTTSVMGNQAKQKTIDDLPGPSQMSTLYWLFVKGYFRHAHQFQIEQSKVWGPLWKSNFGPMLLVNVASAELIEQVLRQDGRTPVRTDMPHWRSYRELRNKAYGPLSEMGEKWLHIRSILNPRLLKPKHVSSYTATLNDVVTDFIHKLSWLRDTSGGQEPVVHTLVDELYKFAFESICSVLFETRMGCMEETIPEETQHFIFSVAEMLRLSQVVMIIPRPLWPYMPPYWKFVEAWDYLFKVSGELIQKKISELEHKVDLDQNIDGAYLTHLLLSDRMTVEEILGSVTELLLAGIDTTSNTMCWALYLLAREPEIQEQLYQEVSQVCPGGRTPTSDDTAQMPFMKAVIKETLRMYPSIPGNARLSVDKEMIVGDYLFPKNTLFHLCHFASSYDERIFPNPQSFQPQRWLRGSEHKSQMHPFGSIPFGFGTRGCLGRRIAELEMYLLLTREKGSGAPETSAGTTLHSTLNSSEYLRRIRSSCLSTG